MSFTAAPANTVSSATGNDCFQRTRNAYQNVWKACPYTSFAMFDYLVKEVGARYGLGTWKLFLEKSSKPTLAIAGLSIGTIGASTPDRLWSRNSGLCTSFALRVVAESGQAGCFSCGSAGGHRAGKNIPVPQDVLRCVDASMALAWRREDPWAVLVDSSAREAIYFQSVSREESVTYGREQKTVKWRWADQTLTYQVRQVHRRQMSSLSNI